MVMKTLREGASGGIGKFILFGFMTMAVGGLVFMDIGGFFRGGTGSNNVIKVGHEKISIQSFDRDVRRQLQRLGLSPQDAYMLGYTNQILAGKIRESLMRQAAADNDIKIDRKRVAAHIQTLLSPMIQGGQSPENVLRQILMNQGMSEREFVSAISTEMSTNLLARALTAGVAVNNDELTEDLYMFQNEIRNITYVNFPNKDVTIENDASNEDLLALYEAEKENYAIAETRDLQIIKVKDDELKKTIDISDEEIRQTYDDNIDYYTNPPSWTLQQALLDNQEQADKVKIALDNGKSLEQAVKIATEKNTGYLGEKTITENGIMEDIRDNVLNAQKGEAIGPIETPLGWTVVVVKDTTPAKTQSFSDVKADIKAELMENMIVDQKYELANTIDDLLASGTNIESIKEEVPVTTTPVAGINKFGVDETSKEALKPYGNLAQTLLQAAFELSEGETSPVMEMADGSFMAVHLAKLHEKSYQPFEDVKADIQKRWSNDQKRTENLAQVRGHMNTINNNDLKDWAKTNNFKTVTLGGIKRSAEPKSPLLERSIANLFEAPKNTPILIDTDSGYAIASITDIELPKITEKTKNSESYKKFANTIEMNAQREALDIYLDKQRNIYGAEINQTLLSRAYGQPAQ